MAERRYTDEEVQRILAHAAEQEAALPHAGAQGLTLAEIQSAAAQAGLSPASVAVAAAVQDRVGVAPREPGLLGLPISVGHAVPLQRPLAEAEWRRLVAELRQTFDAEGRERVDGDRREWRNGNLRIVHEPAGEGAFLELRTRRSDARALINTGGAMTLTSAVIAGMHLVLASGSAGGLAAAAATAAAGVAMAAMGALRVRPWARRREQQFEAVSLFARRLAGE